MDRNTVSRAESLVQEKETGRFLSDSKNPGDGGVDEKEHDGTHYWWEGLSHWESGTLANNVKHPIYTTLQ